MTTSEIANALGVSRGTVSRVINGSPLVKPETRERILAELVKIGYKTIQIEQSKTAAAHKLAVIVFSQPEYFWEQIERGVRTAAQQIGADALTVDYFVTDILNPHEQLELLRSLREDGYNAFVLAPNNPYLLLEEVDSLTKSGIPVIIINVDMANANRLCYIGCDYTQSGALAAEIMSKCCSSASAGGKLLMLALRDPVVSIEHRIIGFRSEYSRIGRPVDHVLRFNRKSDHVYEEVRDVLAAEGDQYGGIYVSIGALEQTARAVIDTGFAGRIAVVGYDISQEIYEYMKSGAITATICHEPFHQGYGAVRIMHRYLTEKTAPESSTIFCKLEAVFASNALHFLNEAYDW